LDLGLAIFLGGLAAALLFFGRRGIIRAGRNMGWYGPADKEVVSSVSSEDFKLKEEKKQDSREGGWNTTRPKNRDRDIR